MRRKLWITVGGLLSLVWLLSGCLAISPEFDDDFSDTASGWRGGSYETYTFGYQNGKYVIQVTVPRWFVWSTAGRRYDDVEISAVTTSAGYSNNHFGVICRYRDEQFYYFAISSDGYYAIFLRTEEGELLPLTGAAMLRSNLIRLDGAENRLVASCRGRQLTFYVNGELLAQVEDDTLGRGDVGMAAGTLKEGGSVVWFDDYEVSKP